MTWKDIHGTLEETRREQPHRLPEPPVQGAHVRGTRAQHPRVLTPPGLTGSLPSGLTHTQLRQQFRQKHISKHNQMTLSQLWKTISGYILKQFQPSFNLPFYRDSDVMSLSTAKIIRILLFHSGSSFPHPNLCHNDKWCY